MAVDPYQDCPCGSGKKFKWCCQRLAKYAERAEQLLDSDQPAAALVAIEEGLQVDRDSLWLRTLKAEVLLSTHDHDKAYPLLDEILAAKPGYQPAIVLRLQDQMAHGAMPEAVNTIQDVLESASEPGAVVDWVGAIGRPLADLGHPFAAFQHLWFAVERRGLQSEFAETLSALAHLADLPPWIKDDWKLAPDPAGDHAADPRWHEAIEFAHAGRWRKAAKLFEALNAERPESPELWLNLGLCRAWTADEQAAASALARYVELEPNEERAVHAAALAQSLDARVSSQTVEVAKIRYAIRDRTRLIQNLKDHKQVAVHFLDAEDNPFDPEVRDEFHLLDRPARDDLDPSAPDPLPTVIGTLRLRPHELELEFAEPAADDRRPGLTLEIAGDSIDGNGERQDGGQVPLSVHRLRRIMIMPAGATPEIGRQIQRRTNHELYHAVWPHTPHGWLDDHSPTEAARLPELRRRLRAAVLLIEFQTEARHLANDMDELRGQLGLDREPVFDGPDVDVGDLPLARLRQVRAEALPTPALVLLFQRATQSSLPVATRQAAAALIARPQDRAQFDAPLAFQCLVRMAMSDLDRAAAQEWIDRARRFGDQPAAEPESFDWDVLEWEVCFQFEPMKSWAPKLAELFAGLRRNERASAQLMATLARIGLVRVVPHPQMRDRLLLDTRMLEQVLAPFVARAPGTVDLTPVAAQPGKIWTPGAGPPAAAPVWSPGQQPTPEPGTQRPKLWTPEG